MPGFARRSARLDTKLQPSTSVEQRASSRLLASTGSSPVHRYTTSCGRLAAVGCRPSSSRCSRCPFVVVVEVEVDAELRRPRLVDGREARGVEAAFRPGAVGRGVREARRLDRGRRGLEVARLERVEPERPPVCTSAQQVPCVVKGLVPVSEPRSSRRVAERIVAPSGIDEVSNETTVLYWRSWLLSPTRRALVVLAVR